LQCVAVCCSTLLLWCMFTRNVHPVAVCCSVMLQVLQRVSVCCILLQCVSVCCILLQCVSVCCILLHPVAVCCILLQCVAALDHVQYERASCHYQKSFWKIWKKKSRFMDFAGTKNHKSLVQILTFLYVQIISCRRLIVCFIPLCLFIVCFIPLDRVLYRCRIP